ncbi:type II toxin-antitoxin system PemK/MazF family toxin [Lysobacter sp. A6]|uniref:Type II toxin-antitoxin system PemK/MazF family toxin n=1 Tax=Noviluteimonas lactosilytica TaxID=2888523 RepID=A0ABS8JF82_9GAMM|nr:type II toxin-antitoxin system PemK/MazF family toxin [Lysobacter lactosilyticus]MCC8362251.1 type II toxin-antitoxin system PemK/MazF family toxin [Lysobacter lactosilyticus]
MGLPYQPRAGDILMCEFPACFDAPEMTKTRPVIVVSPRLSGRMFSLATVVPISGAEPHVHCDHHGPIPVRLLPKFMQATGKGRWAKCDMVYTLSTHRLRPVERGLRDNPGQRLYEYPRLDLATLRAVPLAIAAGVGIDASLWSD